MLKKHAKDKDKEDEQEAIHANEGQKDEGGQDVLKEPTEKEKLLALYQTLKDLGINSIGDLEVKISRL